MESLFSYLFAIALYVLIPLIISTISFHVLKKSPNRSIKIIYIISFMPAFALFNGLWGIIFKDKGPGFSWPSFIPITVEVVFCLFFIYVLGALLHNKGSRLLTFTFFIINLFYLFVISFLAIGLITNTYV